jgi:hypothetical protein
MFAYGDETGREREAVDGELNLRELCTSSSADGRAGAPWSTRL